ncbi:hypothetical protein MUG84_11650 [Paenibacillus sp. KQZ6P-2]|uniref:Uncharacterized protein n=1 Tax=Paenibacillus mangrovi TaxID=2931978 RepID=A0A9X1WPR1_9BACL|nr:hypothetical protein [Paenibacillus mangrovi]MCJ8012386.1 hypothetical protein [Paenibacillus mangrovi]
MKKRKHHPVKSSQNHGPAPVLGGRVSWSRKPMTQVVANKKAEQRRTWCRKGTDDGAIFLPLTCIHFQDSKQGFFPYCKNSLRKSPVYFQKILLLKRYLKFVIKETRIRDISMQSSRNQL